MLLSRLPFQNRCQCGSCQAKGWPQRIAPLPWADVVKPQRRIELLGGDVKPETPLPPGPPDGSTVAENFPTQNIRDGYSVELLRLLDPGKNASAMCEEFRLSEPGRS